MQPSTLRIADMELGSACAVSESGRVLRHTLTRYQQFLSRSFRLPSRTAAAQSLRERRGRPGMAFAIDERYIPGRAQGMQTIGVGPPWCRMQVFQWSLCELVRREFVYPVDYDRAAVRGGTVLR